ncbi:hypothetical protein SAMN05421538_102532 [Paracoccus isoporae]|uniref:Excalibur calcium-binding domain-containing protein n=1 Tax=Paracoccus isoporae TaxID=591205 RepID=A0A1G6Y039_9RHOB|nr:hypothetical protein [Paracoccus isoporae]SDD82996.1 hypothetical protein SAMN05421538_102532 [Paracoccus isoporae]
MKTTVAVMLCALGLAGCADPKYGMTDETAYGRYLLAREAALMGEKPVPQIVPRARPFKAPTAEEIEGPTFWEIVERDTARLTARGTTAATGTPTYVETSRGQPDVLARPVAADPAPRVVVRGGGGGYYYDPDTGERLDSASVVVRPAPEPVARATQTDALARYALSQRHAPGTSVYPRDGGSAEVAARACARFPNANAAQLMFMTAGGPELDPYGVDPDGDGYVCGWDPTPYRTAQL